MALILITSLCTWSSGTVKCVIKTMGCHTLARVRVLLGRRLFKRPPHDVVCAPQIIPQNKTRAKRGRVRVVVNRRWVPVQGGTVSEIQLNTMVVGTVPTQNNATRAHRKRSLAFMGHEHEAFLRHRCKHVFRLNTKTSCMNQSCTGLAL